MRSICVITLGERQRRRRIARRESNTLDQMSATREVSSDSWLSRSSENGPGIRGEPATRRLKAKPLQCYGPEAAKRASTWTDTPRQRIHTDAIEKRGQGERDARPLVPCGFKWPAECNVVREPASEFLRSGYRDRESEESRIANRWLQPG